MTPSASPRRWPPLVLGTLLGIALTAGAMAFGGRAGPLPGAAAGLDELLRGAGTDVSSVGTIAALARLLAATSIGLAVTLVQRHARGRHVLSPSVEALEQAQVLLALAGGLMMMVIGNSLAHAFGIAGAASIIRFRTPVEDPREITILFLAMALGMAAGLGAFAIAGLGTLFLCGFLVLLRHVEASEGRSVKVRLVSDGPAFPLAHVRRIFDTNGIAIEPIDIAAGKDATMRFRGRLPDGEDLDAQLQRLSVALIADGTLGLKEVTWEPAKVH
jgi:hypothetical protein